jgi:phospholipase/carboxylesterase
MKHLAVVLIFFCLLPGGFLRAQTPELQEDLCLKYLVYRPAAANAHTPMLVLLHGYGSNERDLFELQKELPRDWMVVCLRAPLDAGNGGYQWYNMSRDHGHHSGKKEDLDQSRDLVMKCIGQLQHKYHTDPAAVYVGGFSQGGMMSYLIGLSHPEAVAGIAPLSGMIIDLLKPEFQLEQARKKLRIFVAHGDSDDRLAIEDDKASVAYLQKNGLKPEFHIYPGMKHQISPQEIKDLTQWLSHR